MVDAGQLIDDADGNFRVLVVFDAFVVELGRYERFLELTEPQLQQGT